MDMALNNLQRLIIHKTQPTTNSGVIMQGKITHLPDLWWALNHYANDIYR